MKHTKNNNKNNTDNSSISNEAENGLMFDEIITEDDSSSENDNGDSSDEEYSFFATAELDVKEIKDRCTLDDEISRAVREKVEDDREDGKTAAETKEKADNYSEKDASVDKAPDHSKENTAASGTEEDEDDDFGIEIIDLNERRNKASIGAPDKNDIRKDSARSGKNADNSAAPAKKSPEGRSSDSRNTKRPASDKGRTKAPARRPAPSGKKEKGPGISLQLILLFLILAISASAVVIFIMWNKGKDAKVREGEVTNSYAVEVNDEMVYLPDSKLAGHKDDGKTTILCLGNEPFADDLSETGLAGQIEKLSNADVINASFPKSQVTCLERKYDPSPETRDDIFNLFYVANSINLNDFTAMETVASFHDDDGRYMNSVETLKNTDFNTVDMIAIMYDAADYLNGMSMQNPDDKDDLTTYVNSLSYSFKLIQDKYPWIRIVFMSPYYVNVDNADSRTNNIGNGTLVNYFQWSFDTCAGNSVSFIDDYYGSVNENNYSEYTTDGLHLNEAGRTKVADHFVYKVIEDNYSEYDVDKLMTATDGN